MRTSIHSSTKQGKPAPRYKFQLSQLLALCLVVMIAASSLSTVVNAARLYVPALTTTKTDAIIGDDGDNKADPGETIEYTVTITNSGTDATGVTFQDTIDANTTLVAGSLKVSPIAVNNAYSVIGNTQIVINAASGVLANDLNPLGGSLTVTGTNTAGLSGNLAMNPDGSFTFTPAVGFTGSTSFTYTISNGDFTDTATVNLTVANMIWWVNSAGAAGDGRSISPFNTLSAAQTASAINDTIFLATSASDYTGGITLKNGQKLCGGGYLLQLCSGLVPPTGTTYPLASTPAKIVNAGGSGITLAQNNTVEGFLLGNTTAAAITGSNFGTLILDSVGINTTNGALSLDNGTATITLSSLQSSGGTNNVSLTNVNGNINLANTGGLSGASGTAFNVNGGTAAISYSGSISKTSAGNVVAIANKTGGSVTLGGAITCNTSCSGISVASNSGGSYSFTGTATLSTGTNNAVNLTNNSGATINFGPGTNNLNITTTSGTGFNATGGGTVNVYAGNGSNAITATTGTALNVVSTTIGASGLNFRSITSNGGSNTGIILSTTGSSGSLTVTGNSAAGTGGTIANKSGADASTTTGVGIYLNDTKSPSLSYMQLNDFQNFAILGFNVNGFTLSNSVVNGNNGTSASYASYGEGSIYFGSATTNGLTGTANITNTTVSGGRGRNFSVVNTSGTLNQLTISGSAFNLNQNFSDAGDSIAAEARNSGTVVNVEVNNTTITGAPGDLIDFTGQTGTTMNVLIQNNTLSNNHAQNIIGGGGVSLQTQGSMTFNVVGNSMRGADGSALTLFKATSGTLLSGAVDNNTIGVTGVADSGSKSGNGIFLSAAGSGTITLAVRNNIIRNYSGNAGIFMDNTDGNYALNLTATGNTTAEPGASAFAGLALGAGAPSSVDSINVCAQITGNNFSTGDPTDSNDIIVGVSTAGSSIGLPGYAGTTLAAVQTLLLNNNNFAGTVVIAYDDTATPPNENRFVNCATPPLPSAPVFSMADPGKQLFVAHPEGKQAASLTSDRMVAPMPANFGGSKPLFSMTQPAPAQSGETVTANIGTLPAGKSVTIKFRVTVNNPLPLGTTQISNQGTVSGSNFSTVLTDDPDVAGASNPTITLVDLPDATVSSINRNTSTPTNASSVTWTVTFDTLAPVSPDGLSGLTASNFSLVNTGLGGTPTITAVNPVGGSPSNVWTVTAGTGTGNGTLGLNLVNATGLSHEITTSLPYIGGVYTIDRTAPTTTSFIRQTPATSPTNADSLIFRVAFSEDVAAIGTTDFVVTGTTATPTAVNFVSAGTYDVTVSGGNLAGLDGVVALNFAPAMDITDLAGNALANTEPVTDETYTLDNTSPSTISFMRQVPSSSLTNADTLVFRVTFSETVFNVNAADFTASGTTGTPTGINPVSAGVYDVTVSGGDLAGYNGTVGLNFSALLDISDQIGNAVPNTEPAIDETYTLDNTAPAAPIVVTPANGSSTSDSTPAITGTAEPNVTVSVYIDGALNGTSTANGSGNWSYTATTLSTGSHTVKARATDAVNNTSVDSNTNTFSVDTAAPTVTINQAGGQTDPTGASPINFTVTFNESVTGFDDADVTLSGTANPATAVVTGGPIIYNVAVSGMTTDGTVIASIAASVAQDLAGNNNDASTSTDNSVTYDTQVPDVTINQDSGQVDPTNASPINFKVVFTEAVTDFNDASDVILSGTAGATTAIISGGPVTYNVAVSGMTSDGTVIAKIPASAVIDVASNFNTASTSTDNTVTFDGNSPDTTITGNPTNPTFLSNATFTFTGNDGSGTGIASFECELDGGGFSACTGPQSYNSLSDGSHTFNVRAIDNVGNADASPASFTWVVDATAPTTTITNDPFPTGYAAVTSANFNFSGNDGTGVGGLTFSCKLDTGVYTACNSGSISYPGLSEGSHTFYVYATDSLGNADASPATYTWTVDITSPTVTLSSLVTSPTNTSPILVTITFSEPVDIGSGTGDLGITNSPADPAISGGPTVYTFNLTPIADGSVTVQYLALNAFDAAGNANTASNVFTINYDATSPTVSINQAASQTDPYSNSPINFTAIFSESVTGFTNLDVTLSGTALATSASVTEIAPNDGTTYNVAVSGMTSLGTVIADIPSSAAADAAGNNNAASTSTDNTVTFTENIPPDTTFLSQPSNPTSSPDASFSFTGSDNVGVASYECKLDAGSFSACTSPQDFIGLSEGAHNFQVRAIDTVGNIDPTPASFDWIVDTIAPDTTMTAQTVNPSSPVASFKFVGDDGSGSGIAGFECKLDSETFTPCTSPKQYTTLLAGGHTFEVRAVDKAGNTDASSAIFTWTVKTAIFDDVPADYPWKNYIDTVFSYGITSGCDINLFCPNSPTTRAQMSVMILRSVYGMSYFPPPATGTKFTDVPATYWAAAWIEKFYEDGYTAGYGDGTYRPEKPVNRAQAAAFIIKGKYGVAYVPPPPPVPPTFSDTPDDFFLPYIEKLVADGIAAGFLDGTYRPYNNVLRVQMAIFLTRAFDLPLAP